MKRTREQLEEAVASARQAHYGAQVIGHQVPIADTTERLIRAQFALMEDEDPGSAVPPLLGWIAELMRRDDDPELLAGFRRMDERSSTRHAIGARFRTMCDELLAGAGHDWEGPDHLFTDGEEAA